KDDGKAKTGDQLFDLYYKSVGRGACLDLGLSPDKDGLLKIDDVNKLNALGADIRSPFGTNLLKGATLTASNVRGSDRKKFGPQNLLDDDRYSYWATDDDIKTPELVIDLHKQQ